jgi:HSP20 family protein
MKFIFSKKNNKNSKQDNDSFFDYVTAKEEKIPVASQTEEAKEDWLDEDYEEGQLSVDVYQTKTAVVIKSTIAGVKPEDIDISLSNDMVTIRGKREVDQSVSEDDYFYQECYWGGFSRSIILPMEVRADKAEATLKNGVLTIALPKADKARTVSLKVKGDDDED